MASPSKYSFVFGSVQFGTMVSSTIAERYIPTYIILNILVRLPALSLQRLKRVSKEWLRIITNPEFAEAHLAEQSLKEYGSGIILNSTLGILFMEGTSSPIPNPPRLMNLPGALGGTKVLGSCRGLVIFVSTEKGFQIHVANPITGESIVLPRFHRKNEYTLSASIGYVCGTREMKVVVVVKQIQQAAYTPYRCGILALGSKSWREIFIPIVGHRLEEPYVRPLFIKEAFHWCYDTGILSLDLGQEKFHQTEITFCSSRTLKLEADYMVWDGCYALILPSQEPHPLCTVWVLREYGWTKFDIDSAFVERFGYSASSYCPNLCTTIRNGELAIFWQVTKDNIFALAYDLERQVMINFAKFSSDFFLHCKDMGRYSMIGHVNSLVLCSVTPAPSPTLLKRIWICMKIALM